MVTRAHIGGSEDEITLALSLLAHDLRNATSVLWTGTSLMPGASDEEVAEIGADLAVPAQLLLLVVDLLVESARATVDPREPEHVDLAGLVARSATRLARGGIVMDTDCSDDTTVLLVPPGAAERCIGAAAGAVGAEQVSLEAHDGVLTLRPRDNAAATSGRLAEACAQLAHRLAAQCGASCETGGASADREFILRFAVAPA